MSYVQHYHIPRPCPPTLLQEAQEVSFSPAFQPDMYTVILDMLYISLTTLCR